jgi:hypothetical protein
MKTSPANTVCIGDKCIVLDTNKLVENNKTNLPDKFEDVMSKQTAFVGGHDRFPILDRIWDIYAGKGIRTVFVSVGASGSALPDLEIAESLGCPLHCVALNAKEESEWNEVAGILKERKRAGGSDFSVGSEMKWVLPKNLRVQNALPWWSTGTMDVSGAVLRTQNIQEYAAEIATSMKLKDSVTRIDLLKVDTQKSAPGLERGILGAVLNAGFRPALVLVRWTDMPDVHLSATLAAGHLQNSGYTLVAKEDNKFLYYFSDEDMYQICSWEGIIGKNPMFSEIVHAANSPVSNPNSKNRENL